MKFNLKGKNVIVTGGGSGIGRAIAIALAGNGAEVHIFDLKEEEALEVVAEIKSVGGKAHSHKCNVANQDEVKSCVNLVGQDSSIDILINNAKLLRLIWTGYIK